MSYYGKYLGHSHGKWFGAVIADTVRRYILRVSSHVRKSVVLFSRVF